MMRVYGSAVGAVVGITTVGVVVVVGGVVVVVDVMAADVEATDTGEPVPVGMARVELMLHAWQAW